MHSDRCLVHARFHRVAGLASSSPALTFRAADRWKSLSYADLAQRVAEVAGRLRAAGLGNGEPVGLVAHRHPGTVVAALAILANGGPYVALDPQHPAARRQLLSDEAGLRWVLGVDAGSVGDADADVLLTRQPTAPARSPGGEALAEVTPESPAYITFTSGTTGRPKGVVVPHRAIVRLVDGPNFLSLGPDTAFLLASPLSFDASTLELWAPLLNGGRCVLYPQGVLPTASGLREAIAAAGVNSAWLTSSLFNTLVDHDVSCLAGLRDLLIGGEALSVGHVRKALREVPGVQLVNGYGPTENTTFTTCYRIPRDLPETARSVPIGYPVNGTEVVVVDEQLQPVADGVPGELVAMGEGLALGYLNQPALTAEKFVSVRTATGEARRGYRTGDRVVRAPGGPLEFLGRLDDQVKIDGYRIEPREIECLITALAGVQQCRVVIQAGDDGRKRIAAYLVLAAGVAQPAVQAAIGAALPAYLVPHHVVVLDRLPINANGKLAIEQLPAPQPAPRPAPRAAAPLRASQVAAAVGQAWRQVLGQPPREPDVNFFDAGGKSLDAIRLQGLLEAKFGCGLEPTFVFEFPTIRAQADALATLALASTVGKADAARAAGDDPAARRPRDGN